MSLDECVAFAKITFCINSYILVLSLLAQRKDERKGTPMTPPFGCVRSFEKSGPRLNSLRFTPLRQTPLFPEFSFSPSPGSKGGVKEKKQDHVLSLVREEWGQVLNCEF